MKALTLFILGPHVFLYQNGNYGADYSLSTKISVTQVNPSSWIPRLILNEVPRGVFWRNSIFVCNRVADCKMFPMGYSEWIDVQGYLEMERNLMDIAVVAGKVFMAGGRPLTVPGESVMRQDCMAVYS